MQQLVTSSTRQQAQQLEMGNRQPHRPRLASGSVPLEEEEARSQEAVDAQEAVDFQEAVLEAEDFPVEADPLITRIMACHLGPLPRRSPRTSTPGGARLHSSMGHGPPIKLGLAG